MIIEAEKYDESFYNGRVYPDYSKFKHIHKKRAEYLVKLGVTGKVLEIGCAYGYMVEELIKLGIDAKGIDVSEYAVSQSITNVSVKNVKDLDFNKEDFDYIVSYNCLDNVISDKEASLIAEILNSSKAKQIHIVVMEGDFGWERYIHQIILRDPAYWTNLYPSAKIICYCCWNIYQHNKSIEQRGNWY